MSESAAEIETEAAPVPATVQPGQPGKHGLRDYALLLALACCWSSTYALTKIGLTSIPPITFISARSLVAAAFLLVILRIRGIKLPTDLQAWKMFAGQQIINSTFPFLIITWAQLYVPASSTVVLASTTPIFSFVITWAITRHEPATPLKLAGAILGLAGTGVIIGLDAIGGLGTEIVAEMGILLATISFAFATIFGVRLSEYNSMVVAAGSLLFGGFVLLPASLVIDHPWTLRPTAEALMATVAMGIFSSALGLMLFYMCLNRLGTITTNAQSYLRIPIGVALSVLLLGETVPPNLALDWCSSGGASPRSFRATIRALLKRLAPPSSVYGCRSIIRWSGNGRHRCYSDGFVRSYCRPRSVDRRHLVDAAPARCMALVFNCLDGHHRAARLWLDAVLRPCLKPARHQSSDQCLESLS